MSNPLGAYLLGVLIGIDQLGNTLLGGNADETISARLGREDIVPLLGPIVRAVLNKIERNHTEKAMEYDDLGIPSPRELPGLGKDALLSVLKVGEEEYPNLPDALMRIAEEEAWLQRLRESGVTCCIGCGRYL